MSRREVDTQRSKLILWLWTAAYLVFFLPAGSGQINEYRTSPVDFHRRVRDAFVSGENALPDIEIIINEAGDHSFDALMIPSSLKLSAFKLERSAWKAWSDKHYAEAIRLYRRAAEMMREARAQSEVAFCFYYIAEICSEQEKHDESLRWLNQALGIVTSRNAPYLEALLFQSKGYALWFMDYLQDSIHAFSLALERWQQIGYQTGIVLSWNNLAALYEELHLWTRADECYKRAFEATPADLDREIRFRLHSNYALVLKTLKRPSQAAHHLAKARELKDVSPDRFSLLELEISDTSDRLERLLAFQPKRPSLRIERNLLLGQLFKEVGNSIQAQHHLESALLESQDSNLRFFMRKSAGRLARLLEREGRYQDASNLYESTFKQERHLTIPEVAFPYSRSVAPIFDGWIRCLIHLGQTEQAWREIQRLVQIRSAKGIEATEHVPRVAFSEDKVRQFVIAGKLETREPLPVIWDDLTSPELKPEDALERLRTQNTFSILEMWPDGSRVYAWLIQASGSHFQEFHLPEDLADIVQEISGPLYSADSFLPPPPAGPQLQGLYTSLIEPWGPLLQSNNVLVIGHKELQHLPLEMLKDREGKYLLQHYNFSYLPSAYRLPRRRALSHTGSVLILPESPSTLQEVEREEIFFKNLFSDLTIMRSLNTSIPKSVRWVHVSTHFRLDDRFWLTSGFSDRDSEFGVFQFLKKPFSCSLLSLGVCDAANSYSATSPYWLGFSELLLQRGVDALVVNRWRLDEFSSAIYRDFYTYCRQGLPMDRALAQARRAFLGKYLRRAGMKVSGQHPFFWAGIGYVGIPGKRLYRTPESLVGIVLCTLSATAVLLCLLLSVLKFSAPKGTADCPQAAEHEPQQDCPQQNRSSFS